MTKSTTAILGSCLYASLAIACASDEGKVAPTPESPAASAPSGKNETSAEPSGAPNAGAQAGSSAPSGADNKPSVGVDPPANMANTSPPANNNTPAMQPTAAAPDHTKDIRGFCDLKTAFPDDHACIPAPSAEEGFQIHIGPSNYEDPEEVAKYILRPGEESSECFGVVTSNAEKVFYQASMLSGRAGTHHIIDAMFDGGGEKPGATSCKPMGSMSQLGSLPGASKPFMPRVPVAPEYAHVGKSIPAHARMQADMHYYNFTEKDLVREFWLNIYYAKAEDITEESKQIALLGGFGWNQNPIQPKTDKTYSYSCPVKGNGWILELLGHYHAHGKQFDASLTRKATGKNEQVFQMYDYMEPAQFEYNTVVTNPNFSATQAGAVTGRLQVFDGDVLNWSCHIINDSDVALKYVNEVKTGEMCNLWGQSIGVQPLNCFAM